MELDLPHFIEELIHKGASAAGTDAATYVAALVSEDWNGREVAEMNSAYQLPEIDPTERKRALKRLLEQRAKRLQIIPMTGRERPQRSGSGHEPS